MNAFKEMGVEIKEENNKVIIYGKGLGSLIAHINLKSKKNRKINFNSLSLKDIIHNKIGSQEYLRKINKLDRESITKAITRFLNE